MMRAKTRTISALIAVACVSALIAGQSVAAGTAAAAPSALGHRAWPSSR